MKKLLLVSIALLSAAPALAQAPRVGPLDARNGLAEIKAGGSSAQATARTNLGLGGASTLSVGTTTGTVADGGALTSESATARAAEAAAQATANAAIPTATLGQPNGPAQLGSGGTLPPAQLPSATTSALGAVSVGSNLTVNAGILSLSGANVAGALGYAPVNPSTLAASATTDTTNAANITSGTLAAGRLPLATSSAVGGVTVSTGLSASSGALSVLYGTAAGTAAAGNDSRITGALQATTAATTYAPLVSPSLTGTVSLGIDATHNGVSILSNVSGQRATLQFGGVDATRGAQIFSAGVGTLYLGNGTDGASVQILDSGGVAVNQLGLSGSTTGNAVSIIPIGTDTNIPLNLQAKGSSSVQFLSSVKFQNPATFQNTVNFQSGTVSIVNTIGTPSAPVGQEAQVNVWNIPSDQYANPVGVHTTGFSFNHNYGGGNAKGGRVGLELYLNQSGLSADQGVDNYYVAAAIYANANRTQGGTDTTFQGAKGRIFSFNPVGNCGGTATNYYQCSGMEVNFGVVSTASAAIRSGITAAALGDNDNQGAQVDTAFWTYNGPTTAKLRTGWLLGSPVGAWPMDPNGSIIETETSSADNPNITTGWFANLWTASFNGGVIRSRGFQIDGAGNETANSLEIGNALLSRSASGIIVSAPKQLATAVAISSGGSGYYVGSLISTPNGGQYTVAAVSGTTATALTMIQPDTSASPPSNPVTTTTIAPANSNSGIVPGTGLTLNLTWAAANAINLGNDATHNGVQIQPAVAGQRAQIVGAGVDATRGLNILASGSGTLYLGNTTGGAGVSVVGLTGAAANTIALTPATTGVTPAIAFGGTDTNVSAIFQTQGTGTYTFTTATNGTQFQVGNTASSVNYLVARGGATATPALLAATGIDAAIDIRLSPKATGMVDIFGTAATTATTPASFSAVSRVQIKINGVAYWIPATTVAW